MNKAAWLKLLLEIVKVVATAFGAGGVVSSGLFG